MLAAIIITADGIIKTAGVLTAVITIGGIFIAEIRRIDKRNEKNKRQDEEIKRQNEELCIISYGLLACLKGLKELGCNGPVTEATTALEKHINKKAHDQE